ncbi:MAG: PaaI family thioesterase [Thermodesulfobacteriota bacterium]|nr:PaaI family thioesterase [Thermodesulfobacteriota bacterium]
MADIKKFNPAHTEAIAKIVNTSPYIVLLSMELKHLDRGESRIDIETGQKHLQPYGIVHGGVCASLIDAAAYWAVYAGIDEIVGLTTVELKVNYLSPVSKGLLICKGKSIKIGKTICLGEASIEDEKGNLVAHGTSTLMVLDLLEIQGQSHLPPKFLPQENG